MVFKPLHARVVIVVVEMVRDEAQHPSWALRVETAYQRRPQAHVLSAALLPDKPHDSLYVRVDVVESVSCAQFLKVRGATLSCRILV